MSLRGQMKTSYREDIYNYVQTRYNSKIEYLWARFPRYAVFRHNDNNKWYGIIMNVSYQKLGINKDGEVDILNVKLDDWLLRDLLVKREGILPGYHISRGDWISILLDGTIKVEQIYELIDEGFKATASKTKK